MKEMKWIFVVVLAAAQFTAFPQVSNKDEMIKKIFGALKNKDEEGFIKLYPDAATIKRLVWQVMAKQLESDTSGKIKIALERELDSITDSLIAAKVRKQFKRYIAKGEKIGIEWNKTILVSYTSDSTVEEADGISASKLSGKIYFNYNNKEYFLAFSNVVGLEKGWFGGEITRVDEKSRENEPYSVSDDEEIQKAIRADSTRIADSVAAAGKSGPLQKPKQPVKNQPAKGKSPSPAKKPE